MMRILAIGNSFSVDALHYFRDITEAAGMEAETLDLFVGGCSLKQHVGYIQDQTREYVCFRNSEETEERISVQEALEEQAWDIVTIQQASQDSGRAETYEPYGTEVIDTVRKYVPDARIWFHKTWAYEHNSDHPGFAGYNSDQEQMYKQISTAVSKFTADHELPVIPSGDVIQALRQQPCFDVKNGGESLCRDGFHMSMTYGRYAVAAAWFEMLLDGDIRGNTFIPQDTDAAVIQLVQEVVHKVCGSAKHTAETA